MLPLPFDPTVLDDAQANSLVDYTYDEEYDDEHYSEGHDQYCSCRRLYDLRLTIANPSALAQRCVTWRKGGYTMKDPDALWAATLVERLIMTTSVVRAESWEGSIVSGYYGDEVGRIRLDESIHAQVLALLARVAAEPTRGAQTVATLVAEYGYKLPVLEAVTSWQITTLPRESVRQGNGEYGLRLDPARRERYRTYPFARGVALTSDPTLRTPVRLIDGYHRVAAAPAGADLLLIVGVHP